jgi:hypothetical protein
MNQKVNTGIGKEDPFIRRKEKDEGGKDEKIL